MTLDELSKQVIEILFECGEIEHVDFSTVIEHLDLKLPEKSDIEKILELVPPKDKIEVIKNVSRETFKAPV